MVKARRGQSVLIDYEIKLKDGTVYESSRQRGPLSFRLGAGEVILPFETMVMKMEPGESKEETIPRKQAFGEWDPALQYEIPRSKLRRREAPRVGQRLELKVSEKETFPVVVRRVTDRNLTLDANHPLAGQDLILVITLREIH
jgi:peptidylprolyl isomerase